MLVEEEVEEIIVEEIIEVEDEPIVITYDIDETLIQSFLCNTTTMSFHSNPSSLESVYPLSCSMFTIDS